MSSANNASAQIAVLGGGAWGTALATVQRRAGRDVKLWARDGAVAGEITKQRRNSAYLPGIELEDGIVAGTDAETVLGGAGCVLVAIPAQRLRAVIDKLAPLLPAHVPVVLCAKGIERDTGMLMSQVAGQILEGRVIGALSGPSFATDVARGLPTAVTVAADNDDAARDLARRLSGPAFRCYSSSDLAGVEIGGALKNVLAIAAGAVDGAGLGASAIAAMVTRGFVELRRVGAAMNARPETLMGLSGLGDLILTCSSAQSRNYSYGKVLGRGGDISGLPLAEGAATAAVAARIAAEKAIDAPIVDATAKLIDGTITVADAVSDLFARPLKSEEA